MSTHLGADSKAVLRGGAPTSVLIVGTILFAHADLPFV
jgi:hypothetical protein